MRGAESSSFVAIDIETLETSLKSYNGENLGSICQVKERYGDTAFDPVVVSIGPYHHGKRALRAMNRKKWISIDYILKKNSKTKLEDYVKSLKKVEHIARSYYSQEINMESNEFVNMLLLDGFFILFSICAIEIAPDDQDLGSFAGQNEDPNNELDEAQEYCFIVNDIFLIENQIPFFILEILYELFIGEVDTAPSLSEKMFCYVEQILGHYPKSIKITNRPRDFHHLLHLCHIYLRLSQNDDLYFTQTEQENRTTTNYWRRAMQYDMAGVKLQKRELNENNPHSLLDVRFSKCVLEIPCLTIHDNTPSLFENLVASEQANPNFGNDVTAYIIFMSQLVTKAEDVALLVNKGIIEHYFRSEEEVVDLFTRLSDGIIFDVTCNFYLKNKCLNLEVYYQKHINSWSVWFRQTISSIWGRI